MDMPGMRRHALMLERACRIHTNYAVHRYLMSNAKGREDGTEKAQRHFELCEFCAALVARNHFHAVYGVGAGMTGDSYAIPTKETDPHNERLLKVLPFEKISKSVAAFLEFSKANPTKKFFVTRIGCELANYSNEQIAPLFAGAPSNCSFAEAWRTYIQTTSNSVVADLKIRKKHHL